MKESGPVWRELWILLMKGWWWVWGKEVPLEKIKNCKIIGLSSGASAPEELVQNFIAEIKKNMKINEPEEKKVLVEKSKITVNKNIKKKQAAIKDKISKNKMVFVFRTKFSKIRLKNSFMSK